MTRSAYRILLPLACLPLLLACPSDPAPPGPGTGGTGGGGGRGGSAGTGGTGGTGGSAGTGGSSGTGGSRDAGRADRGRADAGRADRGGGDSASAAGTLDQVCTPRFTLKLTDTGPKGMIFTEAVGANPEAFVQQIGREVCRVLYRKPEEVRAANHIELNIRDYPGVAAKWGDVGDIGVEISTQHLQNVKNAGRDVRAEIAGILHHEMTHMYQNDDKPEANFSGIANMYEGIADAVRIRNGFPPQGAAPNDKSGRWQDKTYVSQAFFWLYVDTMYPDFLYRLNATMKGKDQIPWTPAEIEKIVGKSADQLWIDYQGAACCRGNMRTCCR
jgi:hypothetical protein